MKKFLQIVLKYILATAIGLIGGTALFSYMSTKTVIFNMKYLKQSFLLVIVFVLFLLLYDLFKLLDGKGKKSTKAVDKAQDTRGKEVSQFFDRDFVTDKELNENKKFNHNTLSSLRSSKNDGILVRAEENKGKMDINFVEPIHTLCVGTTSSGKTSRFVVPSLQLMSMTASKPSFVVTDPKGELFDKCAHKLKQEGYEVYTINLRDAFISTQWNPLTYPYDMFQRSFNLEKEVKVHPAGDNPKNYNLILQRDFDFNLANWFEFNGHAYADQNVLENDLKNISKKLQDDTYTALNDIATTIAPIENTKDASWERTAQRLIHSVMLAMLEDSRIPELGMTREKYNFYNVYKICNTTDGGRDTFGTLKKYLFDFRDKFSKVGDLASTALQNAETTSKNYMGFVSSKTALFSDTGISLLTSKSEVDFVNIDEKPTVIFLIIPDEVRTRYPLAILFVTQLYKRLVEKAQGLPNQRLKRNVYFLLDEFGNMPKFPEFGSIMTVGRSRGIFFELCVQSYSQLYQTYGQDEGKIIKDNCPIQIYIASEDTTTNKEFSELLGKKTIMVTNKNESVGPDGKTSTSTSQQVQSIPIVYPEQLPTFRDKEKVLIKTFSPNAVLCTTITSCYKSNVYDLTKMYGTYTQMKSFDEDKIFYDIKNRNKIMASKFSDDDDDDEDDDLF